ncbi:hypothetical protein JOF56_008520 [Kibdelosporangium banguiense]|uniref:Uncharacterized protein n=1 Tax=Kibdelosporangium banguiense TaxID=1365924 RepID=A0ABS4TUR5_9PSEU|nr:hypothetical protein [Kibdelosporangium banguiense]
MGLAADQAEAGSQIGGEFVHEFVGVFENAGGVDNCRYGGGAW